MTVTTTTNLGLEIPDNAEIARLWADEEETEDWWKNNNDKIVEAIKAPALQTYDVIFSSLGTPHPDVGSGILEGVYRLLPNNWVQGWVFAQFGSGSNFGSSNWRVSLPFNYLNSSHVHSSLAGFGSCLGSATLRDNSSESNSQTAAIQLASTNTILLTTEQGSASRVVQDSYPFTWASDDRFHLSFLYRADV